MTPRQADVLDFIAAYQARHRGVSPSYREIAAATGGCNVSRIYRALVLLEEDGKIRRRPYANRAIEIVRNRCPHCGGRIA